MLPTSKSLDGHTASGVFVRPFVKLFDAWHNYRNMHVTVLKFLIWIPHKKKKKKTRIFFRTGLCPFPELWPFGNIWMKSCQQNVS